MVSTLKLNLLNNIMTMDRCLELIDLELANVLRAVIDKLDTHYYVDALELFSKATQLYSCIKVCVEGMNPNKYKSTTMYIGVRDKFCDLLAGRRSSVEKDDVDKKIAEGRKKIRIVPGRNEGFIIKDR